MYREMGSGKKRERDSTGGSSDDKEEGENQSSKKAKIEDSTSASEGIGFKTITNVISVILVATIVEEECDWVRQQRETREKMQLLVSAFSNSQQDQYEVFRRSSFPKSSVKRIMQV